MLPFITIGDIHISMYGICVLTGIIISAFLLRFTLRKRKDVSYIQIVNIPLFGTAGAFAGAKILYFLTRLDIFFVEETNFWGSMSTACGGMVFYGGLFGGISAVYLYCKTAGIDFGLYADIFTAAIPCFHIFGRIGCFMAGCCYGIESDMGIVYHSQFLDDSVNDTARIPIQLIESCMNIFITIILVYLNSKRLKKGSLLGIYLVLYAVVRFTDEFFRGDEIRGHFLWLSTSQWISLIAFGIGGYMLLSRYLFHPSRYEKRLPTGEIPDGYVYNQYAGAVPPDEQYKLDMKH